MERAIAHMDLDTFFVSCARLHDSRLLGIPVIIGGGERGVVASCSYEARYFGVKSAMPIKMALRLCPDAKVVKGDMEMYSNLSHTVTEIIQAPKRLFSGRPNFSLHPRCKKIRETGMMQID